MITAVIMAIKAIPYFGPNAREPSIKPLLKACREDGDPGVRVNAILTLGAIGANNKEEAKVIVDALKIAINNGANGGVIRLHASRAIGNFGMYPEQANDAISTLSNIVKDPSWETRKSVAYALGRIGGATKPKPDPKPLPPGVPPPPVDPKTGPDPLVIKILQGMLGDSSATVRLEVVESLVLLGPPAVSLDKYSTMVTPIMNSILDRTKNEKDKSVLVWLHMLVMRYDGNAFNDQTIGKVVDIGRGNEPDATIQSLTALSLLGEKAHNQAIPFARDMLRHAEPLVIAAAANYLGGTKSAAKIVIPQMEAAKAGTKDEMLKYILTTAIDLANGKAPNMPMSPEMPKK